MLNSNVVFIFKQKIKHANENVRFNISKIDLIHDFEIVFEKNFNLTNLTTNEIFTRHENFQNFVIVENFYKNVN